MRCSCGTGNQRRRRRCAFSPLPLCSGLWFHRQRPSTTTILQDTDLHEKFYSTRYMPDNPIRSCCNKADCYPTEIKMVGTSIYARRREDGKYILVPAHKVEQNRDNPDGRNHICAPPPSAIGYPPDTVFCFSLGGGI